MIDKKLLTEENGFVKGVVVELVWEFLPPEYVNWSVNLVNTAHLISAKPITGPMAIWNFAPEGVVACVQDISGIKWIYADDYKHYLIMYKPWWAK